MNERSKHLIQLIEAIRSGDTTALERLASAIHPSILMPAERRPAHEAGLFHPPQSPVHFLSSMPTKTHPPEVFDRMLHLLLESGYEINEWDEFGRTPIHVAGTYGNRTAVKSLLAAGANPRIGDIEGRLPRISGKLICDTFAESTYPSRIR